MEKLISKEVNNFITNIVENINDMNIYNLKEIKRFDKVKKLFNTLDLDINILNDLIAQKQNNMLIELQNLLNEYNLPIKAELESSYNIIFLFNNEKICRLNMYGGSFNIFNTTISKKYNKEDIFFYTKGVLLTKPMYKKKIIEEEINVYTTYKTLDLSIKNMYKKIDILKDKQNTFIASREKIKLKKEKDDSFLGNISFAIYKSEWLNYLNTMVDSIYNDINNLNNFIDFLKSIKTEDNEFIEILAIKNALEDFLINELKLTQ